MSHRMIDMLALYAKYHICEVVILIDDQVKLALHPLCI